MAAPISTLIEPFVSANLNTQLWTQFTAGSTTVTYGNGLSINYPASTTSSSDGDLTSTATYDLTGASACIQVLSVANTGATNTDCLFRLGNSTNCVDFLVEGTSIFAQQIVASSQTNLTSTTYDSTTHAWWRIRESGGTTFWETSKDGLTWNPFWSVANPITVTSLNVFIAGTAFGTSTSPGTFRVRYLNLPTSEGPFNHIRVGNGMSTNEVAN